MVGEWDLVGSVEVVAVEVWRDLKLTLGATVGVHEGEEAVGDVKELVLSAADVGDVHVVGRGGDVLELLAGEDLSGSVGVPHTSRRPFHTPHGATHVNGDKVDLGVTVLAGLRGGHVDDLAGTA